VIPAILLAAGASSRMGRPKALLEVGGQTFVRRILDTLRQAGVPEAVVVVRSGMTAVAAEVLTAGFGRVVENPDPDRGQLSSLVVGLDAVDRPDVAAALVTLVDVPLVRSSTVAELLARAAASPAPILRATHEGRHGHPVVFRRVVFAALRAADPAAGAKPVVRALAVEDVEVDDPGVLRDVDTPQDYDRLLT
jgi:molybdenum cofactor cytidylyltransferase